MSFLEPETLDAGICAKHLALMNSVTKKMLKLIALNTLWNRAVT